MPTYITLYHFTQKGAETIKESPKRVAKNIEALKVLGIEVKDIYMTMGQYDLVVIAEAPDDEAAAKAVLSLGMQGNVSTETMRAFNQEEFGRIIAGLP
jgi:uncharacterized protein with GYD domain